MPTVRLNGKAIRNWRDFHRESRSAFGFPEFYGHNMDAWIDCLSTLREGDGMSRFTLGPDDALDVEVLHADILRRQAPEILDALLDCAAAVNERYEENGEKPALRLLLR
ncbi:barstar family protein [Noviherbaspirillum sp. UKPF54]|uniref:barstar family protein n=1 Tax=Noviherbaspirillum sp. UKPF54 TaxID=2601898 RepID=UPI0011B137A0|nr:barstar family protein [Noviherbaspirillum sp. UKPF54]QDZ28808.1 barstar family protein [Noviherbaspirillum sp. UKPF54]